MGAVGHPVWESHYWAEKQFLVQARIGPFNERTTHSGVSPAFNDMQQKGIQWSRKKILKITATLSYKPCSKVWWEVTKFKF